jgi:2-polyprenyl-6-methoxyphenol hydroxylase-like FAD-dependent oxidoreductase
MLNRGDYWQCAYVIPKGGIEVVKREGIDAFRDRVVELSPFVRDRIGEIKSFDDVKLLTVAIDRLKEWHRPGLLCIGDAAHAMSPVGGVGVNLAVQDAVAAANILAEPLRANAVTRAHLAAVQERRTFPMAVIQRMQVIVQNRLLSPALMSSERPKPPFVMRLLKWFPLLRRIPARIIGIGVRPEHIATPERV